MCESFKIYIIAISIIDANGLRTYLRMVLTLRSEHQQRNNKFRSVLIKYLLHELHHRLIIIFISIKFSSRPVFFSVTVCEHFSRCKNVNIESFKLNYFPYYFKSMIYLYYTHFIAFTTTFYKYRTHFCDLKTKL